MEQLNPSTLNLNLNNVISGKGKLKYFNVPIAFDIESTSTYVNDDKFAFMYIWQIAIREDVYIGRTWKSFMEFIDALIEQNGVNINKRIVIYVHNLSFEMEYIKDMFMWNKRCQLNLEERKPVVMVSESGVEFRCSYILSNAPLSQLNTKKYHKAAGDLDYSLIRHHKTPLSDEEIGYCINDVLVVTEYIQNEIDHWGNINNIPKTATGSVRKFCKEKCVIQNPKYVELMQELTLDVHEYTLLRKGFQGGFTHANMMYSDIVMQDVTSWDFTSSYPAVMLSEKFPMTKGSYFGEISISKYQSMIKDYCVLAKVRIKGLYSIFKNEHYLGLSKCEYISGETVDNGRIISCDSCVTVITEMDYNIMKQCYAWDSLTIIEGYYYGKDYLPKDIIDCVIEFYQGKTTLKGVSDKEDEYMRKKAMLNSCYGMAVTSIDKSTVIYDGEWISKAPELQKCIEDYNNNKTRFLFYAWGVWITAYARNNLWKGIFEYGSDYIYSDTDSIKCINSEFHKDFISLYNQEVISKVRKMADRYGIDYSLIEPKTIKGESKPIGVWDFDGHYTHFKTLGAKRYMTFDDNGALHITIAGVQKNAGQEYLWNKYKTRDNILKAFCDGLIFPPEGTGKSTHTYIDDPKTYRITDYLGNTELVHSESGTHLEGTSYELSLAVDYIWLLEMLRGESI